MSSQMEHWCRELFEAQAAKLILYGRALGLSHSEAEDVVQEVFLQLLRRPEPPDQPDRFLVRSFRNRAYNQRRSLWRRLAREFEAHSWFEPAPDTAPEESAAMLALTRLPAEQREVIVLKLWHQHTFEEIATLTAASPNTVAARYRYGLLKLRTQLKGKDHEDLERLGKPDAHLDPASPLGAAGREPFRVAAL
ncbi:MAG: RNA polymerase sigma factor [Proteobacteria bacterium]|nr:RNA polymerase sigma factor [Pseudomonadota bacterium]